MTPDINTATSLDPSPAAPRSPADIEPIRLDSYQFERVHNPNYRFSHPFTDEVLAILRLEEEFLPAFPNEVPRWPVVVRREVGLGLRACPDCKGTKTVTIDHVGVKTGLRARCDIPCTCLIWRRFYSRWEDPRNVGQDYRRVSLGRLLDFAANFRGFEGAGELHNLIATVQANPTNSYFLAGPHGLGKSTLLTGLYFHALSNWAFNSFYAGVPTEAVWIANATTLSAEFRAWEMKDVGRDADTGVPTPLPSIMDTKILAAARAGLTPSIFIEEFDKFKLDSEFQQKMFARIIDAAQTAGGQIVVTSNLSEVALRVKLGEQYGGGIIRRIVGPRGNEGVAPVWNADRTSYTQADPDPSKGGFYVDFWNNTIRQNLQWDPPGVKSLSLPRSRPQSSNPISFAERLAAKKISDSVKAQQSSGGGARRTVVRRMG